MLEQQLSALGLNASEAHVYLALVETGRISASALAKRCRLPRSTVYSILETLVERGLISQQLSDRVTLFAPHQPESILRMLEAERDELGKKMTERFSLAQGLIDQLTPLFQAQPLNAPRLQFFEGKRNVEAMLYEHCWEWQKSIAQYDHTWWGYQDDGFVPKYRAWLDMYWASRYPQEQVLLFSNRSPLEKQLAGAIPRRIIKLLPGEINISSTIWVLGDYVVSIMTRREPHYAFQLRDSVFAETQRQLFQLLWRFGQ